jgi:hypothetical protein
MNTQRMGEGCKTRDFEKKAPSGCALVSIQKAGCLCLYRSINNGDTFQSMWGVHMINVTHCCLLPIDISPPRVTPLDIAIDLKGWQAERGEVSMTTEPTWLVRWRAYRHVSHHPRHFQVETVDNTPSTTRWAQQQGIIPWNPTHQPASIEEREKIVAGPWCPARCPRPLSGRRHLWRLTREWRKVKPRTLVIYVGMFRNGLINALSSEWLSSLGFASCAFYRPRWLWK